jgi:hypothetical protein
MRGLIIFVIALMASCATQHDREQQLAQELCAGYGGLEAYVNGFANCADGTIFVIK